MKNPEIAKVIEKLDNGTITLEEVNDALRKAGYPTLDPWKNRIGRNEKGVGLLDTGTGTLDKVKVIEDENGIRLTEAVFDPKAWEGKPLPIANVQYEEKWYKVAEDGITLK